MCYVYIFCGKQIIVNSWFIIPLNLCETLRTVNRANTLGDISVLTSVPMPSFSLVSDKLQWIFSNKIIHIENCDKLKIVY